MLAMLRRIPKVAGVVVTLESWLFRLVNRRSCAGSVRVYGWPVVRATRGATLSLGDGVRLISDERFSELGGTGRCSLLLTRRDAVCEIGDRVGMSGVRISVRERVSIGAGTLLGAGVTIMDSDMHALPLGGSATEPRTAPVIIGTNVFVGAGAYVLKGAVIGDGAVIGAAAVVSGSVPAGALAVGNPATVVRTAD